MRISDWSSDVCSSDLHAAIAAKLDELLAAGRAPALVSMHSFTPVMHGVARPWEVGILWNRDPRLPRPLLERLRAEGFTVGDNEPYSGADGHGSTPTTHPAPRGPPTLPVERRPDPLDPHTGPPPRPPRP